MLRQLLIVVFAARGSRYFSRTLLLVIADIRVRYRFSCKDLLNPQHANGSSSSGNTVGGVVIFWLLLFSLDIAIGSARILDRSQGSLPPQQLNQTLIKKINKKKNNNNNKMQLHIDLP